MRFPLSLLTTSALLCGLATAAPLPAPASSCSDNINVGVGVGVNIGGGGGGVKVKQGGEGRCPGGWNKSLIQVNLCIEIDGEDHKEEQKHHAQGNKNVKTTHAPKATPRVKNKDNDEKKHPHHTTTTTRRVIKATPSPSPKKHCPEGKTLGGDLLDLCVDIDTDPLWVGGGIKIAYGPSPKTTTTTTRARNGAKPTPAPRPKQHHDNDSDKKKDDENDRPHHCPEGQTLGGALLDLCVDIDTDPLYIGAGIKIGSGPTTTTGAARGGRKTAATATTRGRVSTPTPGQWSGASEDEDGLPPCGKDDPLALLDLCVKVGHLLGVNAKVGGSPSNEDDSDYGNFGGRGGAKIGHHQPTSSVQRPRTRPTTTTTSARPRQTTHRAASNSKKPQQHEDLPACNGKDDPKALLNLCVKVGAGKDPLVGVGATVLGENGTKVKAKVGGATVADISLDNKGLKATVPGVLDVNTGAGGAKNGGLLNLDVGGLLSAKVLASSPAAANSKNSDTKPKSKPVFSDSQPTHQTAPIRTSQHATKNGDDKPLVSADAAIKVTSDASSKTAKKDCEPGWILHLGVCVKAKVEVPGLVEVKADAKVGV